MRRGLIALASLVAGTFSGSLIAQGQAQKQPDPFTDPTAAIEARQAIHRLMEINLNDAVAMLMGQKPFDGVTLLNRTENLHQLALMSHDHFAVPGSFEASKAKPEIIDNLNDYKDLERQLEIAAFGMYTAANNRDPKHLKPALENTFKACQSCHQKYMKQ